MSINRQLALPDGAASWGEGEAATYSFTPEYKGITLATALPGVAYTVRRGFVDEISCTLQWFCEYFSLPEIRTEDGRTFRMKEDKHRELCRSIYRWPLTRITLTDRRPEIWPDHTCLWHCTEGDGPSALPRWLFHRLPVTATRTEQAALDSLSSAAVSHFREVCGFSSEKAPQ